MKEIWKYIPGYEGLYQVSNNGKVKNILSGKITFGNIGNKGYLRKGLTKNKKVKTFKMHRLIAKSFIPNPLNKPQVNHINGIKADNRVENLEWVTCQENIIHSFYIGLSNYNGENNSRHILMDKDIIFIRKSKLKQVELSKIFNVGYNCINSIINRKSWKHI